MTAKAAMRLGSEAAVAGAGGNPRLRLRWLGAALLTLALAGCEAPLDGAAPATLFTPAQPPAARPAASVVATLLPEEAAGFRRGATTPLRDGGQEVGYRTQGRTSAGATVEVIRPATAPDASALEAAFATLLREATQPGPARRLSERGRLRIADPRPERGAGAAPPGLSCAETAGTYGREQVAGLLCVGAARGALLRLRILMPDRDPLPGDARAFAGAILAALRGA